MPEGPRRSAAPAVTDVRVDQWDAVELAAGRTSLTVVPELGLLGCSLRHRGGEHLDLHGGAARVATGHTTGLPLLAPWANRLAGDDYAVGRVHVDVAGAPGIHRDGNHLPIHGTMLGRAGWQVLRRTASTAAALTAEFDAAAAPEVMASFPFPHRLRVRVVVADGVVDVATTLQATGRRAVPVSFGWHPYFTLPGERAADVRIALPTIDHMVLDERMLPTGRLERRPAATRPLDGDGHDDAYRFVRGQRRLGLHGRRRRLDLEIVSGYGYGQVYAPAGSTVVALEPMTAPIAALGRGQTPMVGPGRASTARFRLRLT